MNTGGDQPESLGPEEKASCQDQTNCTTLAICNEITDFTTRLSRVIGRGFARGAENSEMGYSNGNAAQRLWFSFVSPWGTNEKGTLTLRTPWLCGESKIFQKAKTIR